MLLTIDVGNTQTVLGLHTSCRSCEPPRTWRIATGKDRTADELRVSLLSLLVVDDIPVGDIAGAALCSVVPRLTDAWRRALVQVTGSEPFVCSAESAGALFTADYPNPHEIGADRVADAVAARAKYGAPVVVVDFGTATNIEIIDKTGAFVGGIIAPGVETSAGALFSRATKLAATALIDPGAAIGKSTEQAVQSGIVYGEADRVDGLVRRVFDELGYKTPVIGTGGLATMMEAFSREITHVDPELTLEGLRLLYAEANGDCES